VKKKNQREEANPNPAEINHSHTNFNSRFFRISNTTKHRAAQNTRVDFPSIKDQGKTKQNKKTHEKINKKGGRN
jgi:hypothetical protein